MKIFLLMILFCFSANATKILHIGDSHSAGFFGDNLTSKLKKSEDQFHLYASCGAKVTDFVNGKFKKTCNVHSSNYTLKKEQDVKIKNFEEIVKETQPDIISIALGSNDWDSKSWESKREEYEKNSLPDNVNKILEIVKKSKAKCVWSLAPAMPAHITIIPKLNAKLKAIIGERCEIVDPTDKMKVMTSRDKLHYLIPAETVPWANDVYTKIKELKLQSERGISPSQQQKPSTSNLQ